MAWCAPTWVVGAPAAWADAQSGLSLAPFRATSGQGRCIGGTTGQRSDNRLWIWPEVASSEWKKGRGKEKSGREKVRGEREERKEKEKKREKVLESFSIFFFGFSERNLVFAYFNSYF